MPLVAAKCPICGAGIQVPSEREKIFCTECGKQIIPSAAIAFYNAVFGKADTAPAKTAAKPPQKPLGAYIRPLLEANAPTKLKSPASLQAVAQFEQQHGPLPASYREFLLAANGGDLCALGPEFYGIGPGKKETLDRKNASGKHSNRDIYKIPDSLYIVGNRNWYNYMICVDRNTQEAVAWSRGEKRVTHRWDSLSAYLKEEFRCRTKRNEHVHPALEQWIEYENHVSAMPPAYEAAIARFEQEHGIRFPAHYRELLLFANGIDFPHAYFYGVSPVAHRSLAEDYSPGGRYDSMDDSLYIVGSTSYGDRFCIDTKTGEIIQWDHERGEESNRWATIFECIDDEYDSYEANREDYDDDEDEEEDDEDDEEEEAGPITAASTTSTKSLAEFIQQLKDANIPIYLNPPANPETIERIYQQEPVRDRYGRIKPPPQRFPDYYRDFLLLSNGGSFFMPGPEFWHAGGKEESWSLGRMNQNGDERLPLSMYLIGSSGWGWAVYLDLDSEKIVHWDFEKKQVHCSWDSLVAFLEDELQIYMKCRPYINPTLRQLIETMPHMTLEPPADEQAITQFEQKKGVNLPAYYRELLKFSNGFYWLYQCYSLKEMSGKLPAKARTKYQIPDSLFIVGEDENKYVEHPTFIFLESRSSTLCIDLDSGEFVQWDNKAKKDTFRWANVFDYIDYYIEYTKKREEWL